MKLNVDPIALGMEVDLVGASRFLEGLNCQALGSNTLREKVVEIQKELAKLERERLEKSAETELLEIKL